MTDDGADGGKAEDSGAPRELEPSQAAAPDRNAESESSSSGSEFSWREVLALQMPNLWLFLTVGISFLILIRLTGWVAEFRSGDASAFMCGAIATAFAENIIEGLNKIIRGQGEGRGHPDENRHNRLVRNFIWVWLFWSELITRRGRRFRGSGRCGRVRVLCAGGNASSGRSRRWR